ncbi:MAG: RNA methyltransferase [Chloroflexi bacterium]|nr:RNA methyltransferase [Chloroflexota bacterium]
MPTEARLKKLRDVAERRQPGLTIVVEDVFDPHNMGAIARSCDAFGIQEINVIFETQPAFDPKQAGKNSSTATNKWLNYRIHHSTEAALQNLKREGWQLVATVLDPAAEPIYAADFCHPRIALLFGNEKTGLSPRAIALADTRVTIPMLGIAQSMNVSVSAALAIYEVTRQRRERCPEALQPSAGEIERNFAYLLDMHERHNKRNKRLRKERAKARSAESRSQGQ